MAYKEIIYTVEDYIATITLNRPESLNAFTDTLLTEWVDAIETAKTDPKVRVVIVTGAGRGFCSGMDVKAAAGTPCSGGPGQAIYRRHQRPRRRGGYGYGQHG
jgi:enoyl-CoA hydratase/carnithine racemase